MKESIKKIILEYTEGLNSEDLQFNTQLISTGYIDSFEIIQMIDGLEKAFDITIPLENIELEDFESIEHIEKMIIRKREGV